MNIVGIGTDIVEIDRFENIDEKFIEKYFTDKEIEYFNKRKNNIETIAGNFASKEAVVKAIGTGFSGIAPIDIEVLRNEKGKPTVNVYKKEYEDLHFMITISHTKQNAVAFAIAYI